MTIAYQRHLYRFGAAHCEFKHDSWHFAQKIGELPMRQLAASVRIVIGKEIQDFAHTILASCYGVHWILPILMFFNGCMLLWTFLSIVRWRHPEFYSKLNQKSRNKNVRTAKSNGHLSKRCLLHGFLSCSTAKCKQLNTYGRRTSGSASKLLTF